MSRVTTKCTVNISQEKYHLVVSKWAARARLGTAWLGNRVVPFRPKHGTPSAQAVPGRLQCRARLASAPGLLLRSSLRRAVPGPDRAQYCACRARVPTQARHSWVKPCRAQARPTISCFGPDQATQLIWPPLGPSITFQELLVWQNKVVNHGQN